MTDYLYKWRLLIPDFFPPSLNRTQDKHWIRRHKRKTSTAEQLLIYAKKAGGVPQFSGPVRVSIYRLWGKRQRALDEENLVGAVKTLRDVMRVRKRSGKGWSGVLGIIEDDSPKICKLRVRQRRNIIKAHIDLECTLIIVEGNEVEQTCIDDR